MVISDIELVIARLPERILEAEHREGTPRIKQEEAQILLQAAQRALRRSEDCLNPPRDSAISAVGADMASDG
jgi:hypothetical protein